MTVNEIPVPTSVAAIQGAKPELRAGITSGVGIGLSSSMLPPPLLPKEQRASRFVPIAIERRIKSQACAVCDYPQGIETDHIIPIAYGGTSDEANLQPLCWVCNALKRDLITNANVRAWIVSHPQEYAQRIAKGHRRNRCWSRRALR